MGRRLARGRSDVMDRVSRWFLALMVIGPLHMGEQMLTSLEEFFMIRASMPGWYGMFSPAQADLATVVLITVVWTFASLLLYLVFLGGRARLSVAALFGVFAVTELHHVLEALDKGAYDAGVITCVPYAIAGGYLCKAVVDAWRALHGPALGAVYTMAREAARSAR
jgi:hypothetical protein